MDNTCRQPTASFQFANDSKGFTLNENAPKTAKKLSSDEDRIFTSFSKRRRIQSEQKLRPPREDTYRSTTVAIGSLKAQIATAALHKKRVINAIQLNNDGIRWKLTNCFIEFTQGADDPAHLQETLKLIKQGLKYSYRNMYLFHLNQEPICNLGALHRQEYSIFVHRLPKLDLSVEVYFYLSEQIRVLESSIRQAEHDLGIVEPSEEVTRVS